MEKYRVSPQPSANDGTNIINVLMKLDINQNRYLPILFDINTAQDYETEITRIQDEMEDEVLDFLQKDEAVGYQQIRLDEHHVYIHVVYSWIDEYLHCDNMKEIV